MRKFVITLALIVFGISLPIYAKSPSQNETIEQLVNEVAEAFAAKDLGRLDSRKPYFGNVKITIQHSLGEGAGEFEVRWVKSLGQAERWLKSREIHEMPGRHIMPLLKCKKGACSYNFDGGTLHNTLYLKRITYGFRKGRPYIKSILLLDGD